MADKTVVELKAERGNIFAQMDRLTESPATEGAGMRSAVEKKAASLERQLRMINRQIARLNGSVAVSHTGMDA